MTLFVISARGVLLKLSEEEDKVFELVDGKWVTPRVSEVAGWEIDPREDGVRTFKSESEAIKAWTERRKAKQSITSKEED